MVSENTASSTVAGALLQIVPRLSRLMDRELSRSGLPLSVRQVRVLQRVRDGEQIAAEIARDSSVGPAAMQGVLDGLVERGLVLRERSAVDRRKQLLRLTAEGEEALSTGTRVLTTALDALVADLSPEEHSRIIAALDLLGNAVDLHIARRRQQGTWYRERGTGDRV